LFGSLVVVVAAAVAVILDPDLCAVLMAVLTIWSTDCCHLDDAILNFSAFVYGDNVITLTYSGTPIHISTQVCSYADTTTQPHTHAHREMMMMMMIDVLWPLLCTR